MTERKRVIRKIEGPSKTQVSFRDEVDIRTIMKRWTPAQPHVEMRTPVYGDFSNITSYQDVLDVAENARAEFHKLPSKIRSMIGNDPNKLPEFLVDPENADLLEKEGVIVVTREEAEAKVAEAVTEPGAPAVEETPSGD